MYVCVNGYARVENLSKLCIQDTSLYKSTLHYVNTDPLCFTVVYVHVSLYIGTKINSKHVERHKVFPNKKV